jgi:hypothetical protein
MLDPTGSRFIGTSITDFNNKPVGFNVKHHEYNGRFKNQVNAGFENPQFFGNPQDTSAQVAAATVAGPVPTAVMPTPGTPVPTPVAPSPSPVVPVMAPGQPDFPATPAVPAATPPPV